MLSFTLTNIVVQGLVAAAAWWLSGFDSKLSSDNTKGDIFRRVLRCVITLLLVEISFWAIWQSTYNHDRISGFVYIATALPLAIMWCGCLSNLLAHGFQSLIDSNDKRAFDPNQEARILDSIGQLIRSGRKEEAIRICEALKASGEVSATSLEFFLGHLGVAQAGAGIAKPLAEAERLRSGGKVTEAELMLKSMLLKNPRDLEAAMMLIRLYVKDLNQPEKAAEVLQELEKQPHIPPDFLEIARRSVAEGGNPVPPAAGTAALPESVDELLAHRYFGTALEVLEAKIKDKPEDFELRLKLLEAHVLYCKNVTRAQKILRELSSDPKFTREQIESARVKVGEWAREAKGEWKS